VVPEVAPSVGAAKRPVLSIAGSVSGCSLTFP